MTQTSLAPHWLGRSIILTLLLAVAGPGCGEAEDTPRLETAHLALGQCDADIDCPPTSPCTVGKCLGGECRYTLAEPYCCTSDDECKSANVCNLGSCAILEGEESGQCIFTPDPSTPDCCTFSHECDLPPAGFVSKCALVEELGYKICMFEEDTEMCWPNTEALVINEFLANPSVAGDATGEWIELFNPSLTPIDINGWSLADDDADNFTLVSASPILVPPGGYFLLARSDNPVNNGGVEPDFVYYNFTLSNGADELVLRDLMGMEVDRIEYGADGFTTVEGASLELVSPYMDNSDPISWMTAKLSPAPGMDKGTPGKPNIDSFSFYYTPVICNDNNSCTLDTCGKNGQAVCSHEPIKECCLYAVDCGDGDVCTSDTCMPETLACVHAPMPGCCNYDFQCDDDSDCTIESCANHKCRYQPNPEFPGCCEENEDCADINPCTIDYCTQDPGIPYKTCHYNSPGGVTCCFFDYDCDDGMVETLDWCENFQCKHIPNPDFCTGPPPQYCVDENPCTLDGCNLQTHLCTHEPIADCCLADGDCSDGDPCTEDICLEAIHTCEHAWIEWCCHDATDCEQFLTDQDMCKVPVCVNQKCRLQHLPDPTCCLTNSDCADGDACTEDVCNPGNNTCSHVPLGKGCCNTTADCVEDDDPCTLVTCVSNQCITQLIPGCCKGDWECEDGNPCTFDYCLNYECRFHSQPGSLCCLSPSDCPWSSSPCVTVTCNDENTCEETVAADCIVQPDWVETFGDGDLETIGWKAPASEIGAFVLGPGEGVIGGDTCANLETDTALQGGEVCLISPMVQIPDPQQEVSLVFDHSFLADVPGEAWPSLRVEGRPAGLPDAVVLATFDGTPIDNGQPAMMVLPLKLKTSPFELAFCATVPQGVAELAWRIDDVKIGLGTPPRFLVELDDVFRLPGDEVEQVVFATDPDGDPIGFLVLGPAHAGLEQISMASDPASVHLVLEPVPAEKLGEFVVSLFVTDGFFTDCRNMAETVYVPQCEGVDDCNDENNCTADSCNPVSGCLHEPIEGCCNDIVLCDDADSCTDDFCEGGGCVFYPVDCNDDDVCTDDECDPGVGCLHPFNTENCDDESICTWHDTCYQGECVGLPIDCSDNYACTLDSCSNEVGCLHTSLCSDSILCTTDVCTAKGCRSGKAPVGTPFVDGIIDEQWPDSALAGTGVGALQALYLLVDEFNLYIASSVIQPPPLGGLVYLFDLDFLEGTGITDMSGIAAEDVGLSGILSNNGIVDFPGFGADFAVALQWAEDPELGAGAVGCFELSEEGEPTDVPCLVGLGLNGQVELLLPWTTLYGSDELPGKIAAMTSVLVSPEGAVLDAVPPTATDTVGDLLIIGIPDAVCLVSFCGDGIIDEGEECDDADLNNDFLPNKCRTNCKLAWCGDGVEDEGELCDDGELNSDIEPDVCRTDCTPPSCGDGVADSDEECDDGDLNADDIPNACRIDCTAPSCGDGVVDDNEMCDDGPDNSDVVPGACRKNCQLPGCGDGVVDEGEECDDGLDNSDSEPDACRTSCLQAHCGDGVLDAGEQCDDGPENNDEVPGACRTTCLHAHCGDGVIDEGEECDDGNNDDWDGCQADCVVYITVCGDGVKTPNEQCDWGDDNSDDTPDACRTDCTTAHCGDGIIDTGEDCDDGNLEGGDECGLDCKAYVAFCGNNWIDPGEECDDGDDNSNFLPDHCREDCTVPFCGDMVVDSGEECDKGPGNNDELPNACRTNCLSAHCGDDVVDNGEECDDGPLNEDAPDKCKTDCVAPGCGDGIIDPGLAELCDDGPDNSDVAPDACRHDCTPAHCGDNVLDTGEECDDGPANSDEIADACRTTCLPAFCGDTVIDSGEECDQGYANSDSTPDACRTDCAFPFCGDSVTDPGYGEQCDWGDLNSNSEPNSCRLNCLDAHCGDNVIDFGEECDDGNDILGDGCAPDCSIETYVPDPGDIIITEIMQNPAKVYDTLGEYFEVYNTRDFDIDINKWEILDTANDYHEIDNGGPLLVPAQGYLILGVEASQDFNGGVPVDYQYSDILLGNGMDEVILSYKGQISDEVGYDGGTLFPDPKGASMNLDPGAFDHLANNVGASWCESTLLLPGGDKGTPGQANENCP